MSTQPPSRLPAQSMPRPTRRDFAEAQAQLIGMRCDAAKTNPAAIAWIDAALFGVSAALVVDAEEQRASRVPPRLPTTFQPRRAAAAPSIVAPTIPAPLSFEDTTAWPLPALGFALTELAPAPVPAPFALLPLP